MRIRLGSRFVSSSLVSSSSLRFGLAAVSLALAAGCTADNPEFVGSADAGASLGADAGQGGGGGPQVDAASPGGGGNGQVDLGGSGYVAPFTPSHVAASYFVAGPADLVIQSKIDTDRLRIDGHTPPDGVVFVADGALAVLAARSVTVPNGAMVRAVGARPLVIVAADRIDIVGLLDAGGHSGEPGAGGAGSDNGPGAGKKGSGSPLDGGGSGGGYGAAGGGAGSVGGRFCGQADTPRNVGGMAYGDAMLGMLLGGSGGGTGSLGGAGCPMGTDCHGGAGGGAVQLTAGNVVRIGGALSVGGGGGNGGCKNPRQQDSGSGGGGGSGGALFIEALSVDLGGSIIAAHGGGGGGGSFDTAGGAGADATAVSGAAAGGAGGQSTGFGGGGEQKDQRGGLGGVTGTGGDSVDATSSCGNSGGGGGAAGRIYFRSRGPLSLSGVAVSPMPTIGVIQ